MRNREAGSFKPLTISADRLPASMAQQEALTSYAAARAKLLLGCYRTGDANDPATYVAAITAILARYPEQVITTVTHPATGLPSTKSWLPSVKEVSDACDDAVEPIVQHEKRLKRIKDQMEAREREDSGVKPTYEQLRARYGDDWGLTADQPKSLDTFKAPNTDQLRHHYAHYGLAFKPKEASHGATGNGDTGTATENERPS